MTRKEISAFHHSQGSSPEVVSANPLQLNPLAGITENLVCHNKSAQGQRSLGQAAILDGITEKAGSE